MEGLARRRSAALLIGAAAAFQPVLISTGGAQDTQAFVLVNMLALALLAQACVDWVRERRGPASAAS